MRRNRKLARAGLLATATAAVTGAALAPGHGMVAAIGAAPATAAVQAQHNVAVPHADPGRAKGRGASAYGLSLTGPVPIAPLPAVASSSEEMRRAVLNQQTQYVGAKAVEAGAARNRADSTIKSLRVPAAGLAADAITARCQGGRGDARVVNGMIAGQRLVSDPRPNTTVPVDIPGVGRAWVTLNKQQRMPDGRLAVTGMEASLPLGPLGRETLRTAHAVCGTAGRDSSGGAKPGDGSGKPSEGGSHGQAPDKGSAADPSADQPAAPAPKPSPVRGNLPVTG